MSAKTRGTLKVKSIDVARPSDGADSATTVANRAQPASRTSIRNIASAYFALTKPRIIELLLVTTVPAMFLAAGGVPNLLLVVFTLIGGVCAAGSANVFNCVLDRDIDERMRRTRRRPLPRHVVSWPKATLFAAVLGALSLVLFGFLVNWLSAFLALGANAFYVLIYTMILKRHSSQNIVWGGIAGCFPPLIGWTAVTGRLEFAPFVLFAIVFFWTPPHTWSLAMRYREDYAAADVPMLPVVKPPSAVAVRILVYSAITVAVSMLLWPAAGTGLLYPVVAAVCGVALLVESVQLLRRARAGLSDALMKPMRLFHWSNSYLSLIFVAAAVDPLLPF